MTYAEYIRGGGTGIISLLAQNQTLKFLLSDSIQPLDSAFLMDNGTKKFTLAVENMLTAENDLTPIANMMKVRFGQYWQVLYNTQPTDKVSSLMTTSNGKLNTNDNTVNQVSGYDSPTMIDSDGSNSTGSHTTNRVVETLNYNDLTNLLNELKNNVFYDKMFTDIKNYVFITVYGNEKG